MPTPAARSALAPTVAYRDVLSDDGTTLRAWTNHPGGQHDGPTVLLCNGLATNPLHWPALLRPDCGVRVVSWNHRGVGGSERPRDPRAVRIDDFVEDALSVMDHFGLERPVVMGWSTGVNIAFELAVRHPERVAGIFAVAGVPGDTFATMLGALHLPHPVARALTLPVAHGLRLGGWSLSPFTTRFPFGARSLDALTRVGLIGRVPDPELAAMAVAEMLSTPVEWFMHLALGTSRHAHASAREVRLPATFVAGSHDLLAGSRDMGRVARRIPGARYVRLRSSHFVQMEHPDRVHQLLRELIERVDRAGRA